MLKTVSGIIATALAFLTYMAISYGRGFSGLAGFWVGAVMLIVLWFIYFVVARIIVGYAEIKGKGFWG